MEGEAQGCEGLGLAWVDGQALLIELDGCFEFPAKKVKKEGLLTFIFCGSEPN